MATDPALRTALLDKLGVSKQRLSQRAANRKRELPMSTAHAVYTIAHEEGIDVAKFLSRDETAEVRALVAQLRTREQPATGAGAALKKPRSRPKPVLVSIAGVKVDRLPGMTAAHAREAQAMAEKVYPALYVFENSARDVISRLLEKGVGPDWWERIVPAKIREKAAKRKADEAKDLWHGKRGAAPIDYLDLTDLPPIVSSQRAWPHLEELLGRRSFFEELVNEVNVSRRVAAHMNPLESDDVKNVEAAFRKWSKLLNAKADLFE